MLKRVHIKGFRSCQDVLIDNIGSMTALVGRNGSGKTNILRAIETLGRIARSSELSSPEIDRLPFFASGTVEIDVEQEKELYRYRFGIHDDEAVAEKRRGQQWVVLKETLAIRIQSDKWETLLERSEEQVRVAGRSDPIRIGPAAFSLPALVALLPESDPLFKHVHRLLLFLRNTRYYPFDETSEPSGKDRSFYVSEKAYRQWLMRSRSHTDSEDSVLMRLFHAYQGRKAQLTESSRTNATGERGCVSAASGVA